MRLGDWHSFLEHSSTLRLLRSDGATWILGFLYRTFKEASVVSLGHSELRMRLQTFLDQLHTTEPHVLTATADRYLVQWAESKWLRRTLESHSTEPQYQLTASAEEALGFVAQSVQRRQQMIGTEGRLRLIIDSLQDIVRGSPVEPTKRIDLLKRERDRLDREIAAIESGRSVSNYHPAQIRERFQHAMHLLRDLQSDFRAVEERFVAIATDVQAMQVRSDVSRSRILGFALDAEEALKHDDEGMSFFAFVRFLLSPDEQSRLRTCIHALRELDALSDDEEGMQRLGRMIPSLLQEAERVMRTTARLSSVLKKLLDSKHTKHRLRVASILGDIKSLALQMRAMPPEQLGIVLEAETDLHAPMERPFWTLREEIQLETPNLHMVDVAHAQRAVDRFASLPRLNLHRLRERIRDAVQDGQEQSLAFLWQQAPPSLGIVDLIGYIQIAHDDGHRIEKERTDAIEWVPNDRPGVRYRVQVPHITFLPSRALQKAIRKPR